MKTTIFGSAILTAALLIGGGCKKKEGDVEAAQKNVENAAEKVNDQQKDVAKEQKDVVNEQKDVNKEVGDVNSAKVDLAAARTELETAIKTRTEKLELKIQQLEAKGDAKSKEAAASFRARKDQMSAKMTDIGTRTDANWNEFKTDLGKGWDQLDSDVDAALK